MKRIALAVSLLLLLVAIGAGCAGSSGSWRTASRESAGIAPDPAATPEAVLHVYGASTYGWRGYFAIHTWVAAKHAGDTSYTVYEVIGFRQRRGLPLVRIEQDIPDRRWYGNAPRLLKAHQGDGVDALIDQVDAAARTYPWADTYTAFPGPNSNTFIAWIGQQVPALGLELPFSAIGSGYLSNAPAVRQ